MLTLLQRGWTALFGELPAATAPPAGQGASFALLVALLCLGLGLAELHGLAHAALPRGIWRMVAHTAPCLAAVALLAPVSSARRALPALLLLAPLLWRFAAPGAAKASPFLLLALLLPGAVAARLCAGRAAFAEAGLGLGDLRWWAPRTFVGLLLVIAGSAAAVLLSPTLASFYPASSAAKTHLPALLRLLTGVTIDFIGWELIFRGVMLHLIARRGDPLVAIAFQMVPFFLLHYDKPGLEFWISVPGGVLLGWFCLRAGTFWPAFLLHSAQYIAVSAVAFALRNAA